MKYYGYVTSRSIGRMIIPVPAQNSALREYVALQNGTYVLPPLESYYDNCFHQLFDLINHLPNRGIVIMYSLQMLPSEDKLGILAQKCREREIQFVFVLENCRGLIDDGPIVAELLNYRLGKYSIDQDLLNRRVNNYI